VPDILRVARDLHDLLGRERPGRWVVLVVISLVASVFEMLGALAIYLLLALLTAPESVASLPLVGGLVDLLPSDDLGTIRMLVAGIVMLFFVIRGLVMVGRAYVETRLVTAAGVEISDRLLAGYLAMPYPFHTRRNTAEMVRNAFTATTLLQQQVMLPLAWLVGDIIVVTGLAAIVLASEPLGGVLAVVFLGGVTLVIQRVLRPRLTGWSRRSQDAASGGLQAIQQSLGGIRDIKLLGQEQTFLAEHRYYRRRGARALYLSYAAASIPRALIELAMVTAVVVLTFAVIATGASVDEALAAIGLFAYAGLRLQPVLQRIVTSLNQIRSNSAIVDDLAADLAEVRAWESTLGDGHGREPAPADLFTDRLVLDGVRFTYAPDEPSIRPALLGIDLSVQRGEFLGICGPTGGGKSTLLDLIVGLLQPTEGSVNVDGRTLDAAPGWWWSQLGVVSQQVFLTDDTLRRNIAFGVPAGEVDEARLARCVERAQLTDMLSSLPEGLDTIVGERGIRLSGGQRQRVAVARALYREQPVVVLDEGTSALDGATEAKLIAALDEIAPDRTLIAVAHRLATLRDADRIVVVADGRINASGTYDELMETSPLFRELAGVADVTSAG
jgi:ABC-type multidrug transport system fused ATPase/permease subunit